MMYLPLRFPFLPWVIPKGFDIWNFLGTARNKIIGNLGYLQDLNVLSQIKKPWEYIWIFRSSTSIWNRNIPKICRYNCREATEICWEVYFHNTIESERCPFLCPHKWVSFTNEITHRAALYYTLGEKCGLPT